MAEVILENLKSSDKESLSLSRLGEQMRDSLDTECKSFSGWIKIFIGLRTQNGTRTDNDIAIFGDLKSKYKVSSEDCLISTFAAVIECKGHSRIKGDDQNIRFSANNVEVKYKNRRTGVSHWENASTQVADCARGIKSEIGQRVKINTYINDFIWLYNLNNEFQNHENIFGSKFSVSKFFRKIILDAKNRKKGTEKCIINHPIGNIYRATKDNRATGFENKLLRYAISISPKFLEDDLGGLTRTHVERITKNRVDQSKYYSEIGNKMIVFDGGPGTGKTASLLYCSKKLCDEGNKILLVTFNHVLRCDLIRLLEYAKMGLMADNGVHPKSAVQFFTDLLLATQLISPEQFGNGFFDKDEKTNKSPYEQSLELLFELIKEKPLQDNEDLKNTIACYTNFDYIMIDESQDWLTLERDIIIQLWTSKKILIAQSPEQLTRGSIEYTDWTKYLPRREDFSKLPRRKSLRQGKVLVNFNKIFLDNLKYQSSSLEEEPDMGGGHIIVCEGSYTPEIHRKIFDQHLKGSEKKYDFSFACHNKMGNRNDGFSRSKEFFREGIPLWDGCNDEIRRLAPIGEDLHRMMFYDSCRGIESWTFVCLEYDRWLEEIVTPKSYEDYRNSTKQLKLNIFDAGGLDDEETTVRKLIARWAMIPLTRAVSTTVIQINSKESHYGKIVFSALEKIPDENFDVFCTK